MSPDQEVRTDRGAVAAGTAGGASAGATDKGIANGASDFNDSGAKPSASLRNEEEGPVNEPMAGGGYDASGLVDTESLGTAGDATDERNAAASVTGPGAVPGLGVIDPSGRLRRTGS